MGNLQWEDVRTVQKYFPMRGLDGKPAWVVTGGGATKFLLEASRVCDRTVLCGPLDDPRIHKDLDISVFDSRKCRLGLIHPHELFVTTYGARPERCSYEAMTDPGLGFYFEFLHGCHFGTPAPELRDVVMIVHEGQRVYVTSPEYEVATRLFALLPPRDVDYQDLALLRSRFTLDLDRILTIAVRTPFAFIEPSQMRQIAKGELTSELDDQIVQEVRSRHPGLERWKCLDEHPRSMALFAAGEFRPSAMYETYTRADDLLDAQDIRNCGVDALALLLLSGLQKMDMTESILKEYYRPFSREDRIPFCLRALRLLFDLKRLLEARGLVSEFDSVADAFIARLIQTPYLNVFLEKLALLTYALEQAPVHRENMLGYVRSACGFFQNPKYLKGVR